MPQTLPIKKTTSKVWVNVKGRSCERTVYIVNGKRCIAKYKEDTKGVRQKSYVPVPVSTKPKKNPKMKKKQKGGDPDDWQTNALHKNQPYTGDFTNKDWTFSALQGVKNNPNYTRNEFYRKAYNAALLNLANKHENSYPKF